VCVCVRYRTEQPYAGIPKLCAPPTYVPVPHPQFCKHATDMLLFCKHAQAHHPYCVRHITHTHMLICLYMHTHTHAHTHAHIHKHTYTHACTHSHARKHTRAPGTFQWWSHAPLCVCQRSSHPTDHLECRRCQKHCVLCHVCVSVCV